MLGPSGHKDTFTRDSLPPVAQWPELPQGGTGYDDYINFGVELTDKMVEMALEIIPL